MKQFQLFARWMRGGCVFYTILALATILLNATIDEGSFTSYVQIKPFLLLFPCGLGISFAGMLRKSNRLSPAMGSLLHYLIVMLSLYLFLWLPANPVGTFTTVLLLFAAFSAIYWLIRLVVHLLGARIRALLEED